MGVEFPEKKRYVTLEWPLRLQIQKCYVHCRPNAMGGGGGGIRINADERYKGARPKMISVMRRRRGCPISRKSVT